MSFVRSIFSPPKPRTPPPPPPVIIPPPPPPPEEPATEIDEATGDAVESFERRQRVGRAALVATSSRGVLSPANTGRRRLSAGR